MSMSRNLTASSCKSRRFVSSLLLQQRLPTPIQLLAVGGRVGVAVAYQGKDLISGEFTCMVPVELCSSAFKEILVTDINCSWGLFPPSPISSQLGNQCCLSDVFL